MHIFVNGEPLETTTTTLAALLKEQGFDGDWLATAVNSHVVPATAREGHVLQTGDKIEVLSPMQGG